jgi:hypothetical protein
MCSAYLFGASHAGDCDWDWDWDYLGTDGDGDGDGDRSEVNSQRLTAESRVRFMW